MEELLKYIWLIAVSFGIPTAITAFVLARLNATITKAEKRRQVNEENRQQFQTRMLKCTCAAIMLGEATALAVSQSKTNGEMKDALVYAKKVKQEHLDFLQEQGIMKIL